MNETFTDTATIKRPTGRDAFGQTLYDSGKTIKCRFMVKHNLVRGLDGSQVTSEGIVMCRDSVNTGDLLVLGGRSFTALSAYQVTDLSGNALYWEVVV